MQDEDDVHVDVDALVVRLGNGCCLKGGCVIMALCAVCFMLGE